MLSSIYLLDWIAHLHCTTPFGQAARCKCRRGDSVPLLAMTFNIRSIIIILPFPSSKTKRRIHMQSFNINDAVRFRLATQQEDTGAKIQVFFGVLLGVILRWIVVDVIKNQIPQNIAVIMARIVVALIATIFVFSGYWQKVKDQPASMRFLNSLVYGISIDALVGPWTY